MGLIGLLMIIVGILNLVIPETMTTIGQMWKFKDAEPSDAYIGMTRVGGVFLIIVGFIILF